MAQQQIQHPRRDLFLQAQRAQGRTTLAGAVECGLYDVLYHLLRQRRTVDQHGVDAPGLGDQAWQRAVAHGQLMVDPARGLRGSGKRHACDPGVMQQRIAEFRTGAGQECQYLFGDARRVKQLREPESNQGGLFRGFGDDRVPRRQRRRDLAGKNCHRKVPRADTYKHAAPAQQQAVAFTGRPRQFHPVCHEPAATGGIVAQEINGFAHVVMGIAQALARLEYAQRRQLRQAFLYKVRSLFKDACPPSRRAAAP